MKKDILACLVKLQSLDEFNIFLNMLKSRRDKLALDGVDIKEQIDALKNSGRVQELKYLISQIENARHNLEAINKNETYNVKGIDF